MLITTIDDDDDNDHITKEDNDINTKLLVEKPKTSWKNRKKCSELI